MNVHSPVGSNLVHIDPAQNIFRVNREAYKSPEVYAREMELIFSKCWLYLGHQSELAKPGDFVSRRVGGRDLIFVKGRDGAVSALYNNCTHRGARVCRERKGAAKTFACPYHGWVFNTSGKLVSTNTDHGYPESFNADGRLNLRAVARLEHYRGFYFVNYNPKAISLHDYLDDARSALDNLCDQAETEMVILPGEHSYTVKANYKLMAENSYDGYHLPSVHGTYFDFLRDRAAGNETALKVLDSTIKNYYTSGRTRSLGMGHAILDSMVPTGRPVAQWNPVWGPKIKEEIDAKRAYLEKKVGKERADYIADCQKNLVIFPNLVINDILAATVRVVEPEGPDFMRVTAWAIGPKEESAALREIRLDNFVSFLGPAGFGSPDDIEMLEICQTGNAHSPIEWSEISKGFPGEGDLMHTTGRPDDENHIQSYWIQWDRVMRGIESLEA
jgi:p-cumate 2,3-dioxygenase alpha subunit